MRYALVAMVTSGCVYGGGAVVGYGQHGWVGGLEGGGGIAYVQTRVGYESYRDTVYLESDVVVDSAGFDSNQSNGFSVGGGYARSLTDYTSSGMFSAGVRRVREQSRLGCNTFGTYELVSLELRYVGEWQLVLVPRIERRGGVPCFD